MTISFRRIRMLDEYKGEARRKKKGERRGVGQGDDHLNTSNSLTNKETKVQEKTSLYIQ